MYHVLNWNELHQIKSKIKICAATAKRIQTSSLSKFESQFLLRVYMACFFYLETIEGYYIRIWWLSLLEKKPSQFWLEIWIHVSCITVVWLLWSIFWNDWEKIYLNQCLLYSWKQTLFQSRNIRKIKWFFFWFQRGLFKVKFYSSFQHFLPVGIPFFSFRSATIALKNLDRESEWSNVEHTKMCFWNQMDLVAFTVGFSNLFSFTETFSNPSPTLASSIFCPLEFHFSRLDLLL